MGCSKPLARQAIRLACIDFCRDAMVVQDLQLYDVVAGQADYPLTIPASSQLTRVLGVMYIDSWLTPSSVEQVRAALPLRGNVGDAQVQSSSPKTYFLKTPSTSTISLYPVPDTAVILGLTVRSAYTPSNLATTVDDILFNYWAEEIAAGAVARLKVMPNVPFTDQAGASVARKAFETAKREATIQARTGLIAAASRVQPRAFA
jgi:hypothetical protein